jgi:hypothetical protein
MVKLGEPCHALSQVKSNQPQAFDCDDIRKMNYMDGMMPSSRSRMPGSYGRLRSQSAKTMHGVVASNATQAFQF